MGTDTSAPVIGITLRSGEVARLYLLACYLTFGIVGGRFLHRHTFRANALRTHLTPPVVVPSLHPWLTSTLCQGEKTFAGIAVVPATQMFGAATVRKRSCYVITPIVIRMCSNLFISGGCIALVRFS